MQKSTTMESTTAEEIQQQTGPTYMSILATSKQIVQTMAAPVVAAIQQTKATVQDFMNEAEPEETWEDAW